MTHNGDKDRDLKARLDQLSRSLNEKRDAPEVSASQGESVTRTGQAMSLGFRVLSEFVAGVLVGGFIGWALDGWLGTEPFGLIAFLFLGMVAGFWNVYRLAMTTTSK